MQYKQWLNEWLENYVKPSSKPKTYLRYYEIVTRHLYPALGSYEMTTLTPIILQRFISGLSLSGNLKTGAGLSPNSVNGIITVIRGSFKYASLMGMVNENPACNLIRPKIREREVSCFTITEQKKIEAAALNYGTCKWFGIVLCLYTGLRIGELLALEWDDIDFKNYTVTVSKTCFDGKDSTGKFTRITDSPKTHTSRRIIPIPKQLCARLYAFKRGSSSKCIISSNGKPICVRAYQRSFEALLRRLNIRHKGFHSLRHTFATRAIECGMDVKTLSEILGHKNPSVTLKRYVHSLMEHKREMMNRLGKMLMMSI